jgi:NAD(P)-dependent dehydrogenase (short-subunit alcohol dehydrogenase family)
MALPPALTKDGYELQFGTNHLGHALIIKQLLPTLLKIAGARIVSFSSLGFMLHPTGGILFNGLKTPQSLGFMGSWTRYGQSKLANIVRIHSQPSFQYTANQEWNFSSADSHVHPAS